MSKPDKPAETDKPYDYRDDPEFIAAVKRGIADADAGRLIPIEEIKRWVASWAKANKLPPSEE